MTWRGSSKRRLKKAPRCFVAANDTARALADALLVEEQSRYLEKRNRTAYKASASCSYTGRLMRPGCPASISFGVAQAGSGSVYITISNSH